MMMSGGRGKQAEAMGEKRGGEGGEEEEEEEEEWEGKEERGEEELFKVSCAYNASCERLVHT